MKKFYSLLLMMFVAISAMAVESTGTYTSSLAGMYNGEGDGTLTITPNGDNYDLNWRCGYYHPMLGGMNPIDVVASNVALVDNVLEATATFQDGAGSGTLKVVLSDDKTEVTYNAEISGMTFTASMTGTPVSLNSTGEDEPLTATFDPADGAELSAFNTGDIITVTFNQPEAVGYAEWMLVDNNAVNPDEAVLRTGMMKKNADGSWYGKFYYEQKLLQGHTYTVTVYPYETEADMQAEPDHNTYSNALGVFTATYTGATAGYEYSPVTVVSITPELGSELSLESNTIVVTFSDVVTLTAERNGGMMGDNTAIPAASEDGKTWTLTVPESVLASTSGSLNINVYVKDAEGKVLQGNMGEDENSYFVWAFTCNVGAPEFTITPATGEIESLSEIVVSYEGGINESYATAEKIQVLKDDQVVYTFGDNDLSYDWIDITWLKYTLPTPITEPGSYTVVFPSLYFSLGEEFNGAMSKKQTVTYTIPDVADGINSINAQDNDVIYNLAGQKVNGNVKGIVIKNGKKFIK